jgi:hypothetical protein
MDRSAISRTNGGFSPPPAGATSTSSSTTSSGAAFDKAVRHYTEAFETRARALYGAPSAVPHP